MPSTTSNYGWTYPISSDDLNAGATSIGSLATGIDTSVAALSTTVNNKITTPAGVPVNATLYTVAVSTNSSAAFALSGVNYNNTVFGASYYGTAWPVIFVIHNNTIPTTWTVRGLDYTGDFGYLTSTIITVTYWRVI